MLLLLMQVSGVGEEGIIVGSVVRDLHLQSLQHLGQDKVTATIDLHGGCGILGSPLEVDNVERRSLVARSVHAPQPRIPSQHLETGAQTQDHVRLLRCLAGSLPVDGPGYGSSLTKVNDCVLETGATDVASSHGAVSVSVGSLGHIKQSDVRSDRFTLLAHLYEHVAVHLGYLAPGNA